MKRFIAVALSLFCLLGVGACRMPADTTTAYFVAEVIEMDANSLLLEVTDQGNGGPAAGDRVRVSAPSVTAAVEAQITVGACLRIEYDGHVMETYPLQIGEVYSVAVVE